MEGTETSDAECTWCKGSAILALACFTIAGIFLLIGLDFLRGEDTADD